MYVQFQLKLFLERRRVGIIGSMSLIQCYFICMSVEYAVALMCKVSTRIEHVLD